MTTVNKQIKTRNSNSLSHCRWSLRQYTYTLELVELLLGSPVPPSHGKHGAYGKRALSDQRKHSFRDGELMTVMLLAKFIPRLEFQPGYMLLTILSITVGGFRKSVLRSCVKQIQEIKSFRWPLDTKSPMGKYGSWSNVARMRYIGF